MRPRVAFFLALLAIGFGLRLGYGIVRYQSDLLHLSGARFIQAWDHDGLEHVLIAHALLAGRDHIVDALPGLEGKTIRAVGQDAVFKAPLYQYFLAGLFALSGFSFALFFPVQALVGGLLSGLVGLITLDAFGRRGVAWFAGLAAAAHPVLVNSASQPYNENLFFFLLFALVWTFINWLATHRLVWALASGALAGLATLTRESALPVFAALLLFGALLPRGIPGKLHQLGVMLLVALAIVAPWSVRNYVRLGHVVPVAAILGQALIEGNNECVGSEDILTPFLPGPCPPVSSKRASLLGREGAAHPVDVLALDRINARLAFEFMASNPGAYLKLSVRRLWTTLLPYNPRALQRPVQAAAFLGYWLLIMPAGLMSLVLWWRSPRLLPAVLAVFIVANLIPLCAILVWPDLRYRVGMDLFIASFAGLGYHGLLERWFQERGALLHGA